MRKLTTRERAFLGLAALIAVAIFVYLILLPMLQDDGSGTSSSLDDVQEKLESMQKLADMGPLMVKMEERMRSQSGFGEMLFKREIADSMIIKYVAEAAGRADIKEIEQLDAKPDTSKSKQAVARSDQAVLGSIVDQVYLAQVMDEKNAGEAGAEGGPPNSNPDSTPPDESKNDDAVPDNATSDASESPEQREESEENSQLQEEPEEQNQKEESEEPKIGDTEQAESSKVMFPPLPRNIPDEARESLAGTIEANQGKTIGAADIKKILDDAGIEDEAERERVTKSLQLYKDRVAEKKKDVRTWLGKIDVLKNAGTGQRVGTFSVRMVFKSKMEQLVKFLYNLQTSAKWVKVESVRISISDQKENILSVDLSMTAKTLYE